MLFSERHVHEGVLQHVQVQISPCETLKEKFLSSASSYEHQNVIFMGDSWLILVGIFGIVLLVLMPSLIARITGKRVHAKTRTGSFVTEPFKTKKERQRVDEQDKIVKELNQFCQAVAFAEIPTASNDTASLWTSDMGFEFPNTDGRPMLTKRARLITSKDNVGKALAGYSKLNNEKATGMIDDKKYSQSLLELYNECT